MPRVLPIFALAAVLLLPVHAQQAPDPANLTGERVAPQSPADDLPINHGTPALQQALLKLRTRASMMMIVAHPDDEDGGFLTFEARGHGARVAMLTLTRGEGGQNLMSADFNDALGLIRTQELLAADRYMGVDQFFGTEVDFGFSKTREESFTQWTHDRVLYDAVRAVRLYRPLVLASVFVGGPTDGHGHHQVAGEINQEVFQAAADPKVFPDMGLPPWAPLKVYARVPFSRVSAEGMYDYATGKTVPTRFQNYVTGAITNTPPTATVLIHEGDPAQVNGRSAEGMEGLSYVQFARQGLALQKTQIGPNVRLAPAGRSDAGYTLIASRGFQAPATEDSIFDGIDTTVPGIATLAPAAPATLRVALTTIDNQLSAAQQRFSPINPEATAAPLRDALRALDTLIVEAEAYTLPEPQEFNLLHELRVKRVQINNALVLSHNLILTAAPNTPQTTILTNARSFSGTLTLANRGAQSIKIVSTRLLVNLAGEGVGSSNNGTLQPQSTRTIPLSLPYLAGLEATRPYFSRPALEQPFYDLATPTLRNAPATPAPIVAQATLDDQGVFLNLAAVVTPQAAPAQALVVVPPVSVTVSPGVAISLPGQQSLPVTVRLSSPLAATPDCTNPNAAPPEGRVGLTYPDDWKLTPDPQPFDPTCTATKSTFPFTLALPATVTPSQLQAVARFDNRNYLDSFYPAGYPGLPFTNFYARATVRTIPVQVSTAPDLHIAYLPGTGDDCPSYFPSLGVTPTYLTMDDITPAILQKFDAVVLGVRAYAAHPELTGAGSKPLLDYAKSGGVDIVQYNTTNYGEAEAPYPISVPGDPAHNVVVEAEPVTILQPAAPLLTWPNQLTADDFDHWVSEHGHGFPASWSPNYEALVEVRDPGQDFQRGGLLIAKTGKGAYIYLAFALYRQLPEGVPGAYRLLANLLSYPKNPHR